MVFSFFFFKFSFAFFLQLLCISLVPLIFPYSAQIVLENPLFCRQNARLKKSRILLEILPAEFIQAYSVRSYCQKKNKSEFLIFVTYYQYM